MKNSRAAVRYAKALLDLAIEQKVVDAVYADMVLISSTIKENKDLRLLLSSPIIKVDKKQAIIKSIFGTSINIMTLSFMLIIISKRREAVIEGIVTEFISVYKDFKGIEMVYVKSAIALDNTLRSKILQIVKSYIKKEVELVEEVEPSLIGGFVINFNDNRYDTSIARKIHNLSREFHVNEYVRKF